MDKYEYKVRADEINRLIAERDFAQAAEIADAIDWRRVKSVMMLCTVSDLYKINRRYDDAKNMLLLAYERRPGGRTICYSLCELCIKTEDFVQAVNFYKEFVQAAPRDPGRYILQYKIYEAQDVSLEERIGVLEELKKRDYREKWAYELAYLYHRVGLATRCVEECDELILWFGEGKYVVKAMELKMLHQPLTPIQQEAYDHRFDSYEQEQAVEEEVPEPEEQQQEAYDQGEQAGEYGVMPEEEGSYGMQEDWNGGYGQDAAAEGHELEGEDELDIQVKTMDVGKFNTINLQEELAAGLQEVLGADEVTRSIMAPMLESGGEEIETAEADFRQQEVSYQEAPEEEEEVEVFFGETGEIRDVPEDMVQEMSMKGCVQEENEGERSEPAMAERPERSVPGRNAGERSGKSVPDRNAEERPEESAPDRNAGERPGESVPGRNAGERPGESAPDRNVGDETGELVMEQMRREAARETGDQAAAQPPRELAGVLSQEANGQIRLVMPENAAVEKQITGQMKIEDILAEWERMKKENQERCAEGVRQHVLQQTGPMFTEFDAAVRDGLLEQLETSGEDETAEGREPEDGDMDYAVAELSEESGELDGGEEIEIEELAFSAEDSGELDEYPEEESEEGGDTGYSDEYEDIDEYEGFDEYFEEGSEEEVSEDGSGEAEGVDEYPEEEFRKEGDSAESEERADSAYSDEFEEDDSPERDLEPEEYSREAEESKEYSEESYSDESDDFSEDSDESEDLPDESDDSEDFFEDSDDSEDLPDESDDSEDFLEDTDDSEDFTEDTDDSEDLEEFFEEDLEQEEFEDDSEDSQEPAQDHSRIEQENEPEGRDEREKETRKPEGRPGRAKGGDIARKKDAAERQPIERDKAKVRALTREEKELYAPFIQSRRSREQLVKAIDNISMAAYTGNVVITGEEGMDTLTLAKNIIREVKMADSNFAGKVAKIAGQDLNDRNVKKTLEEMNSGALIIYKASGMNPDTAKELYRSLQQERLGIIVVLEDTKKAIQKLFSVNQELSGAFTARVDMEALSNDMLVLFGKRYAREMEYSIDELGVLALHTRIEELQTIDHVVTVVDVKRIVDEAIRHASRKTLGHFFDILLAKRYDDEDMVVLTEKDFVA